MKDQTGSEAAGQGRLTALVKGHPRTSMLLGVGVLAIAIAGFLWFRPDKLVVDTSVNESFPSETASPGGGDMKPAPAVLSTGRFRDLEHATDGTATVLETSAGRRYVRLEEFSTSSGPDVIVILSDTPATEEEWSAYDDGEFVALGALKGNKGDQNYAIPDDVDLSAYRSVVIWCRRFNVAFGAAPLDLTR